MAHSVLEAIKQGIWDYEPELEAETPLHPTAALPGSREKLEVMSDRLRRGVPLWHPGDRLSYDDGGYE